MPEKSIATKSREIEWIADINADHLFEINCRAAAAGAAYPAGQQAGYAVASANATPYTAQRGYDQAAYQAAAATQGTYAGNLNSLFIPFGNKFQYISAWRGLKSI